MVPAPPGSPPPLLPDSSLSPWLAHLPLPNQSVRFPRPCPVGPFSWTAFSLRSVSAMLSVTIPTLVTPTLCLYSKLFSICCHAGSSACPDSTPHSLVLFQCSCEKHHYLLRVRAKNLGVLLIICLPLTLLPISKPLQGLAVEFDPSFPPHCCHLVSSHQHGLPGCQCWPATWSPCIPACPPSTQTT